MMTQIIAHALPEPETEYPFRGTSGKRRWRFDFAWPPEALALEVEGGTWTGGRHTRAKGFANDCQKYNEAMLEGWRVLRVTGDQIRSGQAVLWVMEALGQWEMQGGDQ